MSDRDRARVWWVLPLAAALVLSATPPAHAARPAVAYRFSDGQGLDADTAIGRVKTYVPRKGETFFDIARDAGLGYNELVLANPGADPWVPPTDEPIILPTEWLLPEGPHEGLVVNVPEMRLFFFEPDRHATVVTYPVGLGRQDWKTPLGEFRIRGKTENPTWVIPQSIRAERLQEGRTETAIPGGHPENPLGAYRLELTLPSYAIHGTNKEFGIGLKVSHGCVRLYPEHIEALFPLVPVGSRGRFVYQPVKVGVRRGRVLVEVHEDIYDMAPAPWQTANRLIREKGLEDLVDPELLEAAIHAKSGLPTDVGYVHLPRSRPRRYYP